MTEERTYKRWLWLRTLCGGLRQGGLRLERYVEEFLELSKRVSWHDAALGACFQLGLDDETIRCDLPWGDFPLIERINLILFLNGSDFEVEEIPKSRHPAQAGTRRMSPAHPMPNPPPPFLWSSSILLSPEPPSMAKSRQLAAADSSPLAAADSSTPAPAPPLRPPVHAPPECPPVPFLQCDCWIEPVYSPQGFFFVGGGAVGLQPQRPGGVCGRGLGGGPAMASWVPGSAMAVQAPWSTSAHRFPWFNMAPRVPGPAMVAQVPWRPPVSPSWTSLQGAHPHGYVMAWDAAIGRMMSGL